MSKVAIDSIVVEERFRKDYGDMDRLVKSIQTFGLLQPLVVDDKMRLLAGGRRYEACKRAGILEIPVTIKENLDDSWRRRIELEENLERKEMSWAEQVAIKEEIDRLMKQIQGDYADSRATGWSLKDTSDLLGESEANTSRDVELAKAIKLFPELAKEKTKYDAASKLKSLKEQLITLELKKRLGDKAPDQWKWADSHYKIGDSLEGLANLPNDLYHFIECDPPYGLPLEDIERYGDTKATSDEVTVDNFDVFTFKLALETYRVASPNSYMIFWFAIANYTPVRSALETAGWTIDVVPALWIKENASQNMNPNLKFGGQYEPFFVCRKGVPSLLKPHSNIFQHARVSPANKIRHAEKPTSLYAEILDVFVRPGMQILCPFLGSGNFILSCYRKGYLAFGWEKDESVKPLFLNRIRKEFDGGTSS